jgi:hypothetical protein
LNERVAEEGPQTDKARDGQGVHRNVAEGVNERAPRGLRDQRRDERFEQTRGVTPIEANPLSALSEAG